MMRTAKNATGTIIVMLALFLLLLLCFVAFATEAGRWYLVRAELSKSVDAGALAAAKNISNPHVNVPALAREFCVENFPGGSFGTPGSGAGSPAFDASTVDFDKVSVQGTATSPAILAQLLGIHEVTVASSGMAQKREAEIMLALDRSTSMSGTPISDLKKAANSFIDFFNDTQDKDKVGLISFATSVRVERALGTNFVTPIKAAIGALNASGYTNAEDAIDQCDGPLGFTNQNGIAGDKRVQQFMIFFSDGYPTALRGNFMKLGQSYDAVACVPPGATTGGTGTVTSILADLGRPDVEQMLGVDPSYTGDGLPLTQTSCGSYVRQGRVQVWTPIVNTRWYAFDSSPVPGYSATACGIPGARLATWLATEASNRALAHAQELKDEGVVVFVIGLGTVNRTFLEQLATSPSLVYYAPTSAQLQSLFQRIAQEIKLRLVM